MARLWLAIAASALALASAASCQKLPEPVPGSLEVAQVGSRFEVPLEVGDLVAVTSAEGIEKRVQLWFEKPDRTITMIAMDLETYQLGPKVVTIPRP